MKLQDLFYFEPIARDFIAVYNKEKTLNLFNIPTKDLLGFINSNKNTNGTYTFGCQTLAQEDVEDFIENIFPKLSKESSNLKE